MNTRLPISILLFAALVFGAVALVLLPSGQWGVPWLLCVFSLLGAFGLMLGRERWR